MGTLRNGCDSWKHSWRRRTRSSSGYGGAAVEVLVEGWGTRRLALMEGVMVLWRGGPLVWEGAEVRGEGLVAQGFPIPVYRDMWLSGDASSCSTGGAGRLLGLKGCSWPGCLPKWGGSYNHGGRVLACQGGDPVTSPTPFRHARGRR